MNWTRMVVFALASGLAVGLAELLFRGRARNGAYWATVFVSIGLMNGMVQNVLLPQIESRQAMRNIPALAALGELDPAAAEQIRGLLQEISRDKNKLVENQAKVRSVFTAATKKYASWASDEALLTLVQVVLDEIAVVAPNNPELCVQLLFPEPGRSFNYSKIFGKDLADRELKAMESLFRTAAASPRQPIPTEADVSDALVLVVTRVQKRGVKEDVFAAMENPRAVKVDAGQLCAGAAALYQEVLALPANDRGRLLRFMFAQAD